LNTGCILLAGGKSSRLGQDKASVELGGKTLLQISVDNLEPLWHEITVVAAPGQHLPEIGSKARLRVVRDIVPGKGPLIGIYTGLKHAMSRSSLVVGCDMPLVQRTVARYLISLSGNYDIVMPVTRKGVEPLLAVYSRECIEPIATLMDSGRYKIDRLFEMVKVRYVTERELNRLDPSGLSFFNINTAADLETADGLFEAKR
jgi:molybdopterin-guanine dinucleotide biosynthesis protein A